MNEEKRFYLTAAELSDLMGISIGHADPRHERRTCQRGLHCGRWQSAEALCGKALLWLHAAVRWGCDCKEKSIDREVGCPIQLHRLAGKTQKDNEAGIPYQA